MEKITINISTAIFFLPGKSVTIMQQNAFVNLGSMDISNLMPFCEVNIGQIIKASISPLDWLSAAVGFGVLAGFVNNPHKVKMVGLLATGFSGQGTEALVVAVWFSWIFMRTAIWSYITVISIAQLLNLSDYRPLIMPETLLAVVYCIHQYKNFIELSYYFTVAHFLYLSFQLGIPLVLWLAYIIKQKVFSAR
jgi:spore germination protein KB